MTKLLIIFAICYLLLKIAKNGIYVAIEHFFNRPDIKPSGDLIQCAYCQGFAGKEIMKKYDGKEFCSQDCLENYRNSSN